MITFWAPTLWAGVPKVQNLLTDNLTRGDTAAEPPNLAWKHEKSF